jgi:hypothetical protein
MGGTTVPTNRVHFCDRVSKFASSWPTWLFSDLDGDAALAPSSPYYIDYLALPIPEECPMSLVEPERHF